MVRPTKVQGMNRTVRQELAEFKKLSRYLTNHSQDPYVLPAFRGSQVWRGGMRMGNVGVLGHQPCIRALPEVTM